MAFHNILGEKGEEIAVDYLQKKQYRIADRNWRYKKMEIDIVTFKDDLLVIVEVKTRSTDFIENLNELITRKKQKFLIEAANAYVEKKEIDLCVRFDVIFVVIRNNETKIEHVEEAFTAIG
ncbi:MAG: YraN family protein [Bacteroidales bacterium]